MTVSTSTSPTSVLPGLSRRSFLAGSAATAATVAVGSRFAFATPESPAGGDVIVAVFLRGGADGLNMFAPYQMASYQAIRPNIRVKGPGEFADPTGKAGLPMVAGGAVAPFALSGTFAMHPGMEALHAGPWSAGRLAVVHAAGMPAAESDTRSHFDSEKNWEQGSASWSVGDGFLNRYLASMPGVDRLGAVGRGSHLQRSLVGAYGALSMDSIGSFNVNGFADNTKARNVLGRWYGSGTGDLVRQTGANTLASIGLVTGTDFSAARFQPQNGAVYGDDDLAWNLKEVAMLIRANVGLRVAAIDFGGWDTHEGQDAPENADSWYRNRVTTLANALAAFDTDLGASRDEVTLFTMTEFGRTINENGNLGTDHGRGAALMVMGGKVNGGVYGSFPATIADGPEGDLTVLNDYRRVVSEVLSVRGAAPDLHRVFPTYTPQAPLGLVRT